METKEEITKCTECGSTDLIRDHEAGELVCERCGFVISSMFLNQGPEWRAFDAEQRQKRTRVGAPLTWTIHDRGLSTIIGWRGQDAYGRINLPKNILETASVLYRRVVRKRLIRGRSIQGVAAATIYIACRQCKVIRTLEEVANATHISKKELGRNYRFLLRKMQTRVPPVGSKNYVSKFVNQLNLSGDAESIALKILDQAIEMRLTSGRGPAGMAAAATYIASLLTDERRTQGEIARGAHVTEVTIRNRYKELTKKLNIRVDM